MIPRRGLLAGLGALLAAPAIIRTPGLLMPVRPAVRRGGDPMLRAYWVQEDDWSGPPDADGFIRPKTLYRQAALIYGEFDWGDDNRKALLPIERLRTNVTLRTHQKQVFGNWLVGNSKFRG
jgi:hypothetical protein